MTGEKTSFHKPLLSAGDVTDKGHALWLDGNVGYIIQKDAPILTAMRTWLAVIATLGKQLMSVPMKWRSMSQAIVHRGAFGR